MASKRKKAAKLPKPVMAWVAIDRNGDLVIRVRIVPVRGGKRG